MLIVPVHDATHANISQLPPGLAAGYTTGTPDIKWTDEDWTLHPNALRYCQDNGSDDTADILDIERGAATYADAAAWYPRALDSFLSAKRPGQRHPGMYISADNVTPLVNELISAHILGGVPLIIANWSVTESIAVETVQNAAGPFPIRGFQFKNQGPYDDDIFDDDYVKAVSKVQIVLESGEVMLPGFKDNGVYYNSQLQTLGYHDERGIWHRVLLPRFAR